MAGPEAKPTTCSKLLDRIERYRQRYGGRPSALPVTLDEWGRLAVELSGDGRFIPSEYCGIPLRLVEAVTSRGNGLVVKP